MRRVYGSGILLTIAFCSLGSIKAADLESSIAALYKKFPAVQRAHVGYLFTDAETGQVLAEHESQEFFTPASNAKLYTTACGLIHLGADYRFLTELRTSGAWHTGEAALTDLALIGGGDPDLSGRALPYVRPPDHGEEPRTDELRPLREMVDQLWNQGIRRITGNVTGVSARYIKTDYIPDGWTVDDTLYGYGAPATALMLNDNVTRLLLHPSEAGTSPEVELQPSTTHFLISNEAVSVPGTKSDITIRRPEGSNEVIISGTIGISAQLWEEDLAVEDPAFWAAESLVDLLNENGIEVLGEPQATYDQANEFANTVLVRQSAPLAQITTVINKVSQNQHAELIKKELDFVAGKDARSACLQNIGLSSDLPDESPASQPAHPNLSISDGSGLARQDLTTPASTVHLLRSMWNRPDKQLWIDTLPVGGFDGSLQHRFAHVVQASRIHAKTGTVSHVAALSGYIDGAHPIIFSVMLNGVVDHTAQSRNFIDQLCALFLSQ